MFYKNLSSYQSEMHYLDNCSTTRVSEKACAKAVYIMQTRFGNPSSLHSVGFAAEEELELARLEVAGALSAASTEIVFTSGGTESNNLAIFGAVCAKKRQGNKVVTTSIEHSSVLEVMKQLESAGVEVVYLKPNSYGIVPAEDFDNAIDDKTILVSVMAVNNELGSLMPIDKISDIIKINNSPALFHCDAVQAFGKIKLSPRRFGIDLLSVSSHKIHGPKGAGALYVKKGVRLLPRSFGGNQEGGLRPGTQGMPLICAFGAAVSEFKIDENYNKTLELNAYAKEQLSQIPNVTFNSDKTALPYVLNISTNTVKSETMMHFLAQKNVFVSSGSACKKGQKSYVLSELGLPSDKIDTALRISFCRNNTKDDIDALVEALAEGINQLASTKNANHNREVKSGKASD